jgi:hypothetical protein
MATTTHIFVTELEQLRLTRDWTYRQLADSIEERTNRRRDPDSWRRICLGLTPTPHKRTLDILEQYLKAEKAEKRPRRRAS